MNPSTSLVVTSISSPNRVLSSLAAGAQKHGVRFWLIGDAPSPPVFELEGCDFYSLRRQRESGFRLAELTPERHYARKNIGYLLAMRAGAEIIVETDDDNFPRDTFWATRTRTLAVPTLRLGGWVNTYSYFTDVRIWPRGFPLDGLGTASAPYDTVPVEAPDCPIQQGLADENPDVDAVYRLVLPLPVSFESGHRIALGENSWCPFNSQNTTWWADAFPLLYLPAYCSFRMTDIWRSFVAQRIAWANGWSILFTEPTVWQQRNDHDLMRDFQDEVPGYLNNRSICKVLEALHLTGGADQMADNLRVCYEALIRINIFNKHELTLLEAWISDLRDVIHSLDLPHPR